MKIELKQIKKSNYILFSILLLQTGLLVRRIMAEYSGALFWDEWDGRLVMNVPISELTWSLLWEPHNEHRIVFSKILFYLDFALFNGSNAPLLVFNLILAFLVLITVYKILKLNYSVTNFSSIVPQLCSFGIFAFSILQIENFSWGFQSQFFLSVLFPLLSFYFYIRYVSQGNVIWVLLSYLFVIFSIGTIASGNFAIVVVLLASIVLRRKIWEIVLHLFLTCFIFALYLKNYSSGSSSTFETLLQESDFILHFVLVYFTSPMNKLIGIQNQLITALIALVLLSLFLKNTYEIFRSEKYDWVAFVGLMMFSYSVLVAIASAWGRIDSGITQATASRYTTVSLFGWFGALLVIMHKRDLQSDRSRFTWLQLSALVTLLFIPFQIVNSKSVSDVKFYRDFASVVVLQGIQDDGISNSLYPFSSRIISASPRLIQEEKSIFDLEFKNRYTLSSYDPQEFLNVSSCLGVIDDIKTTSDERGLIISGWVTLLDANSDSKKFDLIATNNGGEVIGIGFSGIKRDDVAKQIGKQAAKSGFKIVSTENPFQIFAFKESGVKCQLKF